VDKKNNYQNKRITGTNIGIYGVMLKNWNKWDNEVEYSDMIRTI
jgi:hypothetical protein